MNTHKEALGFTFELVANTDGAARGRNGQGQASAAFVVRSSTGELVASEYRTLGAATNNVAEYTALIMLLEWATSTGYPYLDIRSDSELMVKQINGQYSCNHPSLFPLYIKAKTLLKQMEGYRLSWVPREQNVEADRLCNVALDGLKRKH